MRWQVGSQRERPPQDLRPRRSFGLAHLGQDRTDRGHVGMRPRISFIHDRRRLVAVGFRSAEGHRSRGVDGLLRGMYLGIYFLPTGGTDHQHPHV